MLATFDGPVRAIRCGLAVIERAAHANLHLSVGLHTAEVARRGVAVSGDGVAITQAVADRAPSGEVWVTSTLRDLTAGSGLAFEPGAELDVPSLGRSCRARRGVADMGAPERSLTPASPSARPRCSRWSGTT